MAYKGDTEAQRKATETVSSKATLICNILKFMNASAASLYECSPDDTQDMGQFFEDNFEACISCTMSSNDTIRDLARQLCERLVADDKVMIVLRKSGAFDSKGFLSRFWRLTYVKTAYS